jgi:hypothetical protein
MFNFGGPRSSPIERLAYDGLRRAVRKLGVDGRLLVEGPKEPLQPVLLSAAQQRPDLLIVFALDAGGRDRAETRIDGRAPGSCPPKKESPRRRGLSNAASPLQVRGAAFPREDSPDPSEAGSLQRRRPRGEGRRRGSPVDALRPPAFRPMGPHRPPTFLIARSWHEQHMPEREANEEEALTRYKEEELRFLRSVQARSLRQLRKITKRREQLERQRQ